jgi:ABC-2 type transport system ATP-binding protein
MLEVESLVKTYAGSGKAGAVRALDGIGFAVGPGETFGLLGPNGAGKTTTLRIIGGLLSPDAGEVRFDGRPVREDPEAMRRVTGVVAESRGVYERLNVEEYLAFFGRLYGLSPARIRERTRDLMSQFDLTPHRRRRLGTFSRGMRQKACISRALLHEPRLLLLDEPTSGLDPEATESLWEVLHGLARRFSVMTILCTHNLDEADRLCDRVAIIAGGRIVKEGRPEGLKKDGGGSRNILLRLRRFDARIVALLKRMDGIDGVGPDPDDVVRIATCREPEDVCPEIARAVVGAGGDLVSLRAEVGTLRDAYLRAVRGGGQ